MALELNEHVKNTQVLTAAEWTAMLLSSSDSDYAHFIAVHIILLWQAVLILLRWAVRVFKQKLTV